MQCVASTVIMAGYGLVHVKFLLFVYSKLCSNKSLRLVIIWIHVGGGGGGEYNTYYIKIQL